ncbi:MAG: PA14 domain-containing protein [Gammaproteobacteria bacterium]|nr:PA14 domain-containing protein [Gammaproteobacteria bacterium]
MKNKMAFTLMVALVLIIGGCGSGEPNPTPKKSEPAVISSVNATSNHYIAVQFNETITSETLSGTNFQVVDTSGKRLTVNQRNLSDDKTTLFLQTDSQIPGPYRLAHNVNASANKPAGTRNKIGARATIDATYDFVEFTGSIEPEPYIETVIATSNTTLLITMSDEMEKTSVEKTPETLTSAYRVISADNGRPRQDVGDLVVTKAELDATDVDGKRIILTTTTQSDIEYFVTVANIFSAPPGKLIHPARNKMSFFGMAPVDITGPALVKAVSTGNTGVLLYFSEPLNSTADQPGNFAICATNFDNGVCPAGSVLNISSAELQAQNTLIALTTLPQQSGIDYHVQARNITDQATPAPGNLLNPNPATANFMGSGKGAPQVKSALADSNDHIIITFSERISDDALGNGDPNLIENIYRIDSPALDITMVERVDDWSVRLTTTPQERIDYTVVVKNVQSEEGLLIDSEHNSATFVGVAAKDTVKPKLLGAEAEGDKTTRLYFSEAMDSTSATNTTNYSVVVTDCPADDASCVVGSTIDVVSAQMDVFDTQVILTTATQQPRVEYTVTVSENVTDKAMPLPHNSVDTAANSNIASFGILLDDKDAPLLVRADAFSTTQISLSFNDSMGSSAADANNYLICDEALAVDGTCPQGARLQVLSAELTSAGTQVILTTMPMKDNTTYIVVVDPLVTDATGNKMDSSNFSVEFTFDGATTVADASKIPYVVGAISTANTSVTVSFSSIMGSSAVNLQNYVITQENINGEVGTVFIRSVEWADESDKTAVNITTTSQNEVTYRVAVVNVKDQFGNQLDAIGTRGVNYNPISAVFAGSPATAVSLALSGAWETSGTKGSLSAGDTITVDGQTIVLMDIDLDGVVDNWVDTNGNDLIDDADVVAGMIDSDGDGLSDNEELRGQLIVIHFANGTQESREVSSDPTIADTDGDGLTDLEEHSVVSDPRSIDTDSDGLNDYLEWNVVYSAPNNQDSDGDGLPDGAEHFFFHTSPNLADTDGDQLEDAQELVELNRNPRIADLPNIKIKVGQVKLQIDEQYTYENDNGTTVTSESSTSASLSSGANTSFSNSRETTNEFSSSLSVGLGVNGEGNVQAGYDGGFNFSAGVAVGAQFNIGGEFSRTNSTAIQIEQSSAKESQRAYENSLNKGAELSKTSAVTRELSGARISIDLQVENTGDVALTVKNLQVTVLQIDPQNRNKRIPIATLMAESGDLEINLGPFNKSKGPYIFTSNDVYANLVETLMRDPRSLIFKVSNFDISDEYDRNFAFANQVARDRTAGIVFDFGELGTEEYYIATAGALDDTGVSGQQYVGGFGDAGEANAISLGYLLQSVLGIPKHDLSKDYFDAQGRLRNPDIETGIIAGPNKRVDSLAEGDDIQLVPFNTTGVAPKALVIGAGANGVLDTKLSVGDEEEFVSGYETRVTCGISSTATSEVGNFCSTPVQIGCACDEVTRGPDRLYRVKTFRHGDLNNSWFARTNVDVPAAADFDEILVRPGQDIRLSFLQDLDKDGLFAHEEFLFGSTDSSTDSFDNSKYGPEKLSNGRFREKTAAELASVDTSGDGVGDGDGFPDSQDSDHDGIGDFAEAKLGWLISRNGELERVFSNPGLVDSDGDGLWDVQEQDLRDFCRSDDWRLDALCAHLAHPAVTKAQATAIIAGRDGKLNIEKSENDVYALFEKDSPYNKGLMYGTAVILPGEDGVIDTIIPSNDLSIDDEYTNSNITFPSTDPLLVDTDQDNISDGAEVFGYAAAMSIIENVDPLISETEKLTTAKGDVNWGIAQTVAQGDDVQRVMVNGQTKAGMVLVTAGANGILETEPAGNDVYTGYWFIAPGEDRRLDCAKDSNATDTVSAYEAGTGLLDPNEPVIWSKTSVEPVLVDASCAVELSEYDKNSGKDLKLYGRIVTTDPLRRDSEGDRIADGFEVALGSDPTVVDGANFRDSDMDGLSDTEEQIQGWIVKVNNKVGYLVRSNPFKPDSDFDGLPDFVERDIGTDPNKVDTDDDGLDDWQEFRTVVRASSMQADYDVNGDGNIDVSDKISFTYSADDYAHMSMLFTGFSLVVNGSAINTDPLLSDSDNDDLNDYTEVVTGYRVSETGQNFLGSVILTNPNKADSDGDGLSDYEEKNGVMLNGVTYITDATNADTDGDGRSDFVELEVGSLTDPLMQDAMITVAYDSIYATNLDECSSTGGVKQVFDFETQKFMTIPCTLKTNLLWWLYATGSTDGAVRSKHLLSSSDEFAYVPDGSTTPTAGGHMRLASVDSLAGVDTTAASSEKGLKMSVRACEGGDVYAGGTGDPEGATGCQGGFYAYPTNGKYYSNSADVDFGSGFMGRFLAKWEGYISVPEAGDYEFRVVADDGLILRIDGIDVLSQKLLNGNYVAVTNDALWSDNSRLDAIGTRTFGALQSKIEIYLANAQGAANIRVQIRKKPAPDADGNVPNWLDSDYLTENMVTHEPADGMFSCIGVGRDVTRASYISLDRHNKASNKVPATKDYVPPAPYYGSAEGSEFLIFMEAIEADTDVIKKGSRYFIEPTVNYTTPTIVAAALDLASSRRIITNLVKQENDSNVLENPAMLTTEGGKRYFELSDEGKQLYQQLKSKERFGSQSFVVRKNESIDVSGLITKVDNIDELDECPIGASGVVGQFASKCLKRFSRTFSYDELVSTGSMTLSLRDLASTTGAGVGEGCDVDLTTVISNQ